MRNFFLPQLTDIDIVMSPSFFALSRDMTNITLGQQTECLQTHLLSLSLGGAICASKREQFTAYIRPRADPLTRVSSLALAKKHVSSV